MTPRVVQEPWSIVAIDIMDPFLKSKRRFKYLVFFQDLFTKWIEVEPLRAASAKKIMDSFLYIVVTRWGAPEVLHSDNGTKYNNNLLKKLAATFGIHHSFTPLYHPQANPERFYIRL